MSASESFVIPDRSACSEDNDDVDSLPSISSGVLDSEDDSEDDSDAQQEWEASLEQLQLLLTMVLIPFAGKYFGRKFAYWSEPLPILFPILLPHSPPLSRLGFRSEPTDLPTGWARYMEWMYDVEIRWTSKKAFNAVGVAATL